MSDDEFTIPPNATKPVTIFTEDGLAHHDAEVRADERRKFARDIKDNLIKWLEEMERE